MIDEETNGDLDAAESVVAEPEAPLEEIEDAEEVFSATVLARELVPLPEVGPGKAMWVREVTAEEQDDYEASLLRRTRDRSGTPQVEPEFANAKARFAVICCIKADGSQMFSRRDISKVGKLGARTLARLCSVGYRLSGMDKESRADIQGNSSSGHADDSSSS